MIKFCKGILVKIYFKGNMKFSLILILTIWHEFLLCYQKTYLLLTIINQTIRLIIGGDDLELFFEIFFAAIILFSIYRFVLILAKMKLKIVLPTSNDELAVIRKFPQKIVNAPTFSKQKGGIITYALILVYVITMFVLGQYFLEFYWTLYLLLMLPMLQFSNLLNMFAITDEGVICGARFIAWGKIKSFEFVLIEVNHRFYGHSLEVNNQHELEIKTRFETLRCIITSEEMKEKLRTILYEHNVPELEITEEGFREEG
uniref:DUF5673 domain-containing protein n=1 Tax=Batrachochytrium dendrobatidis (strain JAM81 / FGSC 10211) TaxID=684364 RepID=F4PFV5_BATDJ|eukprot:XP_006683488.1 hypothetical protein BATDEDRAFT_93249 [Batrachochytrium dendrobatidis JAM81]